LAESEPKDDCDTCQRQNRTRRTERGCRAPAYFLGESASPSVNYDGAGGKAKHGDGDGHEGKMIPHRDAEHSRQRELEKHEPARDEAHRGYRRGRHVSNRAQTDPRIREDSRGTVMRSRHTTQSASKRMARDILERPRDRSVNTIGISVIENPRLWAQYFISMRKE